MGKPRGSATTVGRELRQRVSQEAY